MKLQLKTRLMILAALVVIVASGITVYAQSEPPPDSALTRAQNFTGSNADWEPFVWNFDGIDMVLVPVGCFTMGSTDEQLDAAVRLCDAVFGDGHCRRAWFEDESPQHEVCFEEPFWIDRTEVTNQQFGSAGIFSDSDRPRENITWAQAWNFCESRGARLPTEAEWEYAARGPDALIFPWGDTFVAANVVFKGNAYTETASVGSLPEGSSWVGALDMIGNVWEWTSDWYDAGYYATLANGTVNPTGPETGSERIFRGGSWDMKEAGNLRAAKRGVLTPVVRSNSYGGLRCVRSNEG